MKLKISIGYDAKTDEAKERIVSIISDTAGVVSDPKPNAYVTDLASEGIDLSIYFWINTNENSPLAVFDRVATSIKKVLSKSDIEICLTSPIVVQDAKIHLLSENNEDKSKNGRDVF